MPYYCNYSGTGGFTSSTLGDLITGSPKLKVVIKKLSLAGTDTRAVFWQGGSTAGNRVFVFRRNGNGNFEAFLGGSATNIFTFSEALTAFGSQTSLACDEFAIEFDGTTARVYKDGSLVITKTGVVRGTLVFSNALFRVGCQAIDDSPTNTTSGTYAPANSTFGDIQVYINDTLVRNYVTPSTGTSIPDSVGGNSLSQTGTWPANDSEWVFYSSGGTAYADTLLAGSYAHSGSLLNSSVGYSSALQTGAFTHSGSALSSAVARSSTLQAGLYNHSGSVLGSAVGYSSSLQSGVFSYSGSELQSTIQNGTKNYSDTLLGASFISSGSSLQSAVSRNSTLLGGSYAHAGSQLSASVAFYSTLLGGSYSHFGSMLQSTISGQVTVSIEGYTITFASDEISGAFAADTVAATFINDYVSATWSN